MKIDFQSASPKNTDLKGIIKFEEETLLKGNVLNIGIGAQSKYTLEKIRRAAAKLLSQAKCLQ